MVYVIETDTKFQEEKFNQRLQKIEDENESLEMKLIRKNYDIIKLEKQLKDKQVKSLY